MNSGQLREGRFVRSSRWRRWLVPSVLGLLEAREKKVRPNGCRPSTDGAERALQRLVEARVAVANVLAVPPSSVAEPARSAVTG